MPPQPEVPHFDPSRLLAARTRAGLTQQELAGRLHLHRSAINSWETGTAPIPARHLRRIAAHLRLHPAMLQRLPEHPTLADLRSRIALTRAELAQRLTIPLSRLIRWEDTGCLGTVMEHRNADFLAAVLGMPPEQTTDYLRTGRLPALLVRRMATALHVAERYVRIAFEKSREVAIAAAGTSAETVATGGTQP